MARGERSRRKRKKLINAFIIIIIFGIIIWIEFEEYKEKEIDNREKGYNSISLSIQNNTPIIISNELENEKIVPKNKIDETYEGYSVIAKLEIPKIELETCVLTEHSDKALRVSVTKFWGPNPNEIGNLCIAGHNFKNKNMFHNLRKLEVGDTFFIEDNNNRKI